MKRIEIFTGPGCGYCEQAKALLQQYGYDYVERDVSAPAELARFQQRLPRLKALPQIFVDGEHIGGLQDLCIRLDAKT